MGVAFGPAQRDGDVGGGDAVGVVGVALFAEQIAAVRVFYAVGVQISLNRIGGIGIAVCVSDTLGEFLDRKSTRLNSSH